VQEGRRRTGPILAVQQNPASGLPPSFSRKRSVSWSGRPRDAHTRQAGKEECSGGPHPSTRGSARARVRSCRVRVTQEERATCKLLEVRADAIAPARTGRPDRFAPAARLGYSTSSPSSPSRGKRVRKAHGRAYSASCSSPAIERRPLVRVEQTCPGSRVTSIGRPIGRQPLGDDRLHARLPERASRRCRYGTPRAEEEPVARAPSRRWPSPRTSRAGVAQSTGKQRLASSVTVARGG